MQPTVETLRRELAAAFRLAAKHEFNEGVCNHFSVALPGREEHYLINPYGIHWCEMRPSDLLMIDGAGQVLEGEGEVEATARNIHVAGHRANPRHKAIFHVHMPYATSLTMIEGGRLEMAHQTAARFYGRVAYQGFGGVALDEAEGERIAKAQKDNPHADVIFLEHHGVTIGAPWSPSPSTSSTILSAPAASRSSPCRPGGRSSSSPMPRCARRRASTCRSSNSRPRSTSRR